MPFDPDGVRMDFPILGQRVHGKPLVYLDNAATTQKPQVVLDALNYYYCADNANVHRGIHQLSERATAQYERARAKVKHFINASHDDEIVFVRGTTEAINLVAQTYGRKFVKAGDEIVISTMEHHSNIVPWQILCEASGALLRVIPINDAGELVIDEYKKLLTERTRIVAITHVSNALGTINPVKEMAELAHHWGAAVVVDGAQAVPHMAVDVEELGCDFYAFSGHKLFGPTGVGVLYGRAALLDAMPPYQTGGSMINSVSFERTTYSAPPQKFEAGTPNIAGVIGLGAAIDYVSEIGMEAISKYEHELLVHATEALSAIEEVRIIGNARKKASLISFVLAGVHPHDVGTILDHEGVATRSGHHCAMPLMARLGLPATVRASLAFYNTKEEAEALARAVLRAIEVFR
jgi:cysteine desulfurase / selenocysteine lyase